LKNSIKGVGGWLLVVVLLCILSGISNFILLVQRIIIIFTSQAKAGVFISASLLFIYCFLIWLTVFMILAKKKFAIKSFITAVIIGALFLIWYYLVSTLIYLQYTSGQIFSNLLIVIINICITILIAFYLTKSTRVKNTLTK